MRRLGACLWIWTSASTVFSGTAGAVELVNNGNFAQNNVGANRSIYIGSSGTQGEDGSANNVVFDPGLVGWTLDPDVTNPYTYLVSTGNTYQSSLSSIEGGFRTLYGTTPVDNPNSSGTGFYIATDADSISPYNGGVQTTLNAALQANTTYSVSFYQSLAQITGFTSPNEPLKAIWNVTLGGQTIAADPMISTAPLAPGDGITNVGQFIGVDANSVWQKKTLTFVTGNTAPTSNVLKFFATGSPGGLPPFALLTGVSVTDSTSVPEPWEIGGTLIGGAAAFWMRRKISDTQTKKSASAPAE